MTHSIRKLDERIFISYRRRDSKSYVGDLEGALARRGYTVFLDRSRLSQGCWSSQLSLQVELSRFVLAIIGGPSWLPADRQASSGSADDWVERELSLAMELRRVVCPVLIHSEASGVFPDALPASLAALGGYQAIDVADHPPEDAADTIVRTLSESTSTVLGSETVADLLQARSFTEARARAERLTRLSEPYLRAYGHLVEAVALLEGRMPAQGRLGHVRHVLAALERARLGVGDDEGAREVARCADAVRRWVELDLARRRGVPPSRPEGDGPPVLSDDALSILGRLFNEPQQAHFRRHVDGAPEP